MIKKPSETKSKEIGMRYFMISFVAKTKTNLSQLTYGDFTLPMLGFPSSIRIRQSIINLGFIRPAILNIIELSKTDYEAFANNDSSN